MVHIGSRFVFVFFISLPKIFVLIWKKITAKVGEGRIPSIKLWTCSRKWPSSKAMLPQILGTWVRSKQSRDWDPRVIKRVLFSVQIPAIKVKDLKILYIHRGDPDSESGTACWMVHWWLQLLWGESWQGQGLAWHLSLYETPLALLWMSSHPHQASSLVTGRWRYLNLEM